MSATPIKGADWTGRPGPLDALCDVSGLSVGHARAADLATGVTVVLPDRFAAGAVDIRGGGPATRETDLLKSGATVRGVHALVLSGGSVFGLAAADGVVEALSAAGVGLRPAPSAPPAPIAPAAAIYDLRELGVSDWAPAGGPPYRALGQAALSALRSDDAALGAVGAGVGARAGDGKGGLGQASFVFDGAPDAPGPVVGALVVANPAGAPLGLGGPSNAAAADETASLEAESWSPLPRDSKFSGAPLALNTTLIVVATDADLSADEATRFAMMAQDGLARSVRPAHTPYDGDLVFALATGGRPLASGPGSARLLAATALGAAAADCVARALRRGVAAARAEAAPS